MHPGVGWDRSGGGQGSRPQPMPTRRALSTALHIGFLHISFKEKFPLLEKSLKAFSMRVTTEGLNLGYRRIARTFEFEYFP